MARSLQTAQEGLADAIEACDVPKAQALLDKHPHLLEAPTPDGEGETFLHIAARAGCAGMCALLAGRGLDVNEAVPASRIVPLGAAAIRGHVEAARWLLANGATPDGPVDGFVTPLMSASGKGHLEVAVALLDAGAEVNREHLRSPKTALDYALMYQPLGTGQDLVALQLQARGGIQPYAGPHDWPDIPGAAFLAHIEAAIGAVNPLGLVESDGGPPVTVYKTRFAPKRYEHQLLFTTGLHEVAGVELGVCLPAAWPLNRAALDMPRFSWPADLLLALALAAEGSSFKHGGVLPPTIPGLATPWLLSANDAREASTRPRTLPPTLLLTPFKGVPAKASAAADKLAQAKWKAVMLPEALMHDGP